MRKTIPPAYFTLDAACVYYATPKTSMYEILKTGLIVTRKRGIRTLIERESADRYFASLPSAFPVE